MNKMLNLRRRLTRLKSTAIMDIYSKCFDNQNALIGRKAGAYCAENRAVGVSPVCTVCNSSSLSRSGEASSRFRGPPVTEGTHYLMWLRHTSVSCMRMRVVTRASSSLLFFGGRRFFISPYKRFYQKRERNCWYGKLQKVFGGLFSPTRKVYGMDKEGPR